MLHHHLQFHVHHYSFIDIRHIINLTLFLEMKNKKPLFPGRSPQDQLLVIFKALGTPTPEVYPKFTELPEYRDNIPIFPPKNLKDLVPGFSDEAYDLLSVCNTDHGFNTTKTKINYISKIIQVLNLTTDRLLHRTLHHVSRGSASAHMMQSSVQLCKIYQADMLDNFGNIQAKI